MASEALKLIVELLEDKADLLDNKKELSMLLVQTILAVGKGMFLPNKADFGEEPMQLYEDIRHYLEIGCKTKKEVTG